MIDTNKWKSIWNKKGIDNVTGVDSDEILYKLVRADGYDTGEMAVSTWKNYVHWIADKLNLPEGGSVYEVGCGAGAFIYPFHINGYKTAGLDYSDSLIETVKKVIPATPGQFEVKEAIDLDATEKFDAVISNGIFFYFPTMEYAHTVLSKMLEKSNGVIAILDTANSRFKEITESERRKNIENFEEKYAGLEHQYYDKSWFLAFAEENNCDIEIYNQRLNYANSKYRFNCIIRKRK